VLLLKAYTGRRNSELFDMRWDMIQYSGNTPVFIMSPNNKVNQQKNNFKVEELEYAYIPIGQELMDLLMKLGLPGKKGSVDYIIAPEIQERKSMVKFTSKCFTFFFKKLNRKYDYEVQLKHLRQTYVTAEDLFLRKGFSMQHSNYRTTDKHYIDRKEIAKAMAANGFRVFPPRGKRTLHKDTPTNKKDPANLQGLDYQGGAYRSRTDDLLTARDNTTFSTGLHYTLLHYIIKIMYSCFSYILHLFSFWLAILLADFSEADRRRETLHCSVWSQLILFFKNTSSEFICVYRTKINGLIFFFTFNNF
jgi:hypothetical protein